MSHAPLAWDRYKGTRFAPKPNATGWRVQKNTGKQGPQNIVYGVNGTPLYVDIDSTVEALRLEVGDEGGKFLLYQVDNAGEDIPDGQVAQVELRAIAPVRPDEINRMIVEQLKAEREDRRDANKALVDAFSQLSKAAQSNNVAPLESFKAGMKFAEEQRRNEPATARVIELEPPQQSGQLPEWVGPVLEQAKPAIDGIMGIVVQKLVRWAAEEKTSPAPVKDGSP